LVVTGAALEHVPFDEVIYIDELRAIVSDAAQRSTSVLGLCWGGLVLGHLGVGLQKEMYASKLFGVFDTATVCPRHELMAGHDERFWSPQSRYAGFRCDSVDAAVTAGALVRLA